VFGHPYGKLARPSLVG
jgi:hypothetical protein